ncbi:MAG: zinc-ribbon domain-containing protein [Chloroflexota bacterium]
MPRFCPNCGTEVYESALFCPSCGLPIEPVPEAESPVTPDAPQAAPTARTEAHPGAAVEGRPWTPPGMEPPAPEPSALSQINVPLTMPVTLSAWLIGGGAALAALGVLIGLFSGPINPIELLLLVALIGIAVTVFFSDRLPAIPHLRLATLAVLLVAFGVALDRIGFGILGFAELLLFLGTGAAAIGALLLELGYDQPLGGRGTPA